MTRKKRRLQILLLALLGFGSATALALTAFQDNLLFFYSPSDLTTRQIGPEQRFRLGGLVEQGSLDRSDGGRTILFTVTDTVHEVRVAYTGILPDLFREGQGVVAHGRLRGDGIFEADEVLAKHDASYMPPEVAQALQQAGEWRANAAGSVVRDGAAEPGAGQPGAGGEGGR